MNTKEKNVVGYILPFAIPKTTCGFQRQTAIHRTEDRRAFLCR